MKTLYEIVEESVFLDAELEDDLSVVEEVLEEVVAEAVVDQTPPSPPEPAAGSKRRPDQWIKTRDCWCNECRFHSETEPGWEECPGKHVVGAKRISLWATNPEYIRGLTDDDLRVQAKEANISANIMPISPEDQ